jgi:hypothetical protein
MDPATPAPKALAKPHHPAQTRIRMELTTHAHQPHPQLTSYIKHTPCAHAFISYLKMAACSAETSKIVFAVPDPGIVILLASDDDLHRCLGLLPTIPPLSYGLPIVQPVAGRQKIKDVYK